MGAFLHIGFVAKATTELPKGISAQKMNEIVSDYYSDDTFDVKVSKRKITWTLKPEIVQSELAAFAETFYEDYYGQENDHWTQKALAFIQEISTSKDWLKQASKERHNYFSVTEYGCEESFCIDDDDDDEIEMDTTVVILGSEGKFLMEEDVCTLRFLEKSAQKSFANFKLGKTIRAFVF